MADTETTFPELQARIEKTIAFLKSLDRAAFEGADAREIVMKVGPQEWWAARSVPRISATFDFDAVRFIRR